MMPEEHHLCPQPGLSPLGLPAGVWAARQGPVGHKNQLEEC